MSSLLPLMIHCFIPRKLRPEPRVANLHCRCPVVILTLDLPHISHYCIKVDTVCDWCLVVVFEDFPWSMRFFASTASFCSASLSPYSHPHQDCESEYESNDPSDNNACDGSC